MPKPMSMRAVMTVRPGLAETLFLGAGLAGEDFGAGADGIFLADAVLGASVAAIFFDSAEEAAGLGADFFMVSVVYKWMDEKRTSPPL